MILPDKPTRSTDDDDLDFELPLETDDDDEESSLREDESFLPEDDADLGLDSDEKTIGLDADTGVDDAMDSEVGSDDEEEGSWLGDEDADPSLSAADDDEGDEEEALGEDSEPAKDNADDWDEELPFDEGSAPVGDSGEEGFGDEASASDNEIDLDHLPPLDGGTAGDSDGPDADSVGSELDELPIAAGADEALTEVAPGLRCTRIPAARVALETLLRVERPLPHLIASGATCLAWDGALLVAVSEDDAAAAPERRFIGASRPFAMAALQARDELFVALATAQGVLWSRDGGRTFATTQAPAAESTAGDGGAWVAASLAWTASAHGPRLFAAAPRGVLWVSDDLGANWLRCEDVTRVLKLHADGNRTLVAVCRNDDGGASALRSSDGGETFDVVALPVREVERVQDVQAVGDALLCSRRAPTPQLVWRAHDDAWQDLAAFACAPAALLDEHDQVCAYFFVQTQERALLLRKVLSRTAAPAIVCEFEHEAGTPLQLVASGHDRSVTLNIGTERGWYRVRIRPAGEDA